MKKSENNISLGNLENIYFLQVTAKLDQFLSKFVFRKKNDTLIAELINLGSFVWKKTDLLYISWNLLGSFSVFYSAANCWFRCVRILWPAALF